MTRAFSRNLQVNDKIRVSDSSNLYQSVMLVDMPQTSTLNSKPKGLITGLKITFATTTNNLVCRPSTYAGTTPSASSEKTGGEVIRP